MPPPGRKTLDFLRGKPDATVSGGIPPPGEVRWLLRSTPSRMTPGALFRPSDVKAGWLRSLTKVVIGPAKTVIQDINRDTMEFEGLGFGASALQVLLRELGVVCEAQVLQRAAAEGHDVEFPLSARFPWGWERVSG